MKKLFALFFIFQFQPVIADDVGKTQMEKELEGVNFNQLKSILEKDKLAPNVQKKINTLKKIKIEKIKLEEDKMFYPSEDVFWKFASELWLVKNATILKWDVEKPDYGIGISFKKLLELVGYKYKKINLLLVDTSEITHYGLPSNKNEAIILLGIPFMRVMDLTKQEIAVLLLEDYVRIESGYFIENLKGQEYKKFLGQKFKREELSTAFVTEVLKDYQANIYDKGYNFQQQFEVTKKVYSLLEGQGDYQRAYMTLLQKIQNLLLVTPSYKNYTKIYPSPDMQIEWLKPTVKRVP